MSPRPTAEAVTEQYVDGGFSVAARGANQPSVAKFRASERAALRRYERLSDLGLHAPTGHYLEIGCGVGSMLRLMRGAGWDVRGLEPDPDFAAAGEQNYGVTIDAALHENVSYAPRSFQLVASFHVLEHVLSPTLFLQKIHEELAEGGHVFIEVPSIDRPYGGNLNRFFWSAHLTSFSTNTLAAFLQKAGFEVVWQGFAGDFIQAIARKSSPVVTALPADSPPRLWATVKAKGAAYRLLRQSAVGPLTKTLKSGGLGLVRLLSSETRAEQAASLTDKLRQDALRYNGALEAVQFCDRVPSPAEVAFREAVDAVRPFVWTTGDRHSLQRNLTLRQDVAVVLGPMRWSLDALEYWAVRLSEADAGPIWLPCAEFDEGCRAETRRWGRACKELALHATLGVSHSDAFAELSDLGVPCHLDPSPLLAAAREHGVSAARSRVVGLSVQLPLKEKEDERLRALASTVVRLSGHRMRVLLVQPADGELIPWMHRVEAPIEQRSLYGQSLPMALREIAGLAALVTNRRDLAQAARLLGVPALDIAVDSALLETAVSQLVSPAVDAATVKTARLMAEWTEGCS